MAVIVLQWMNKSTHIRWIHHLSMLIAVLDDVSLKMQRAGPVIASRRRDSQVRLKDRTADKWRIHRPACDILPFFTRVTSLTENTWVLILCVFSVGEWQKIINKPMWMSCPFETTCLNSLLSGNVLYIRWFIVKYCVVKDDTHFLILFIG